MGKGQREKKDRKQPHIALFISALRKGGSERVLVNLAEYLKDNGVEVTVVTQYEGQGEYSLSPGIRRVFSEITEEEKSRSRVVNFFRRFFKLRGIWKAERPDVILSFIGKNNLMALLTSSFLRIPVVISVRGEPKEEYYSGVLRFFAKTYFARAAGVVLQTKEAMQFFPERIRKKAVILKNPLNPSFVRERFEGERERCIHAVGRMDANKNHEMILRAFAALAADFPEVRLVIYGNGECREPLIKLSEQLGLSERISLPGAVSDVADKIYRSSVFVLSSYSEGMPNTLIEAMCMGLPVISTDCPCGGPAELIEDGVNGYLIPPGDVKALEERLRMLLSDREKAEKMGRNASKLLEEYRPEHVDRTWMDYLLSFLPPAK